MHEFIQTEFPINGQPLLKYPETFVPERSTAKSSVLRNVIKIITHLNYKTLRFNFTYFKYKDAIKFPVFIKNTHIQKYGGSVRIQGKISPGMIKIGYSYVGHFDKKSLRAIWDVDGEVVFTGSALLKYGSKIIVAKRAYLEIGDKFRISPNSAIICYKKIVFGNNCRLSWDVLVMDTDFHKIKSMDGEQINMPKEITIGNNVWIGTRAMVMKGTKLASYCIVASNSVVSKEIEGSYQIIAGMPAKVVKTGVTWEE